MKQPRKVSPTSALWWGNLVFWLLLLGIIAFRALRIFSDAETAAVRFEPANLPPLPALAQADVASRNPFDPAGTPWHAAGTAAPATSTAPGQVRGIVVLPGVGLAITDHGTVKTGEMLDAGRLVSIKTSGALIDTPAGRQALPLPGTNRPSLQDLNQAKPPSATPPAASKQGKS